VNGFTGRWTLQLRNISPSDHDEPFAAIILATADRQKVDKRTPSKWSGVLRYAMEYKTNAEALPPSSGARAGSTNAPSDFRVAVRWQKDLGSRRSGG
jgi:hypothetical protein